MKSYQVRNWKQFQHYKDRNPPWIKLHFALLASEDWVSLDDASKLLAVVCMLVASRNDGRVPANPAYLKRVAYLDALPDLAPLIECGFLEETLADASTPQADARPETEQSRGETETPKGSNEPSGVHVREISARQVLESILTPERAKALTDSRNRKKAAQTAHAAELVVEKLKAFADPNAAADLMILKGWSSIEPEWGTRNGLALAAGAVAIAGVIPSTFIATDDRRWPALAKRFEMLNGKKCTGMQTRDGYGRYFPNEWLDELNSTAEAAA